MFGFDEQERYALTLTTYAGLSTAIGGLIAIIRRPDDSMLAFLLGTAIGVMSLLSIAEMWIHNAIENGWIGVTTATLCGALLYQIISPFLPDFDSATEFTNAFNSHSTGEETKTPKEPATTTTSEIVSTSPRLDRKLINSEGTTSGSFGKSNLIPRTNNTRADSITLEAAYNGKRGASEDSLPLNGDADENKDLLGKQQTRRSADLLRLGFLMAVTMTLHNAPEGFAVAFSSYTEFGPIMAIAIALHNIPEGYIISLPLYMSTNSRWKALAVATLSGLSEPLGALIALVLGRPLLTEDKIQYVLAFVGGIMAAVCALELWPEGKRCRSDEKLYAGIGVGAVLMAWTLWMGI